MKRAALTFLLALIIAMATLITGCASTPEVPPIVERKPFDCGLDAQCEMPCGQSREWQLGPDGHASFVDLGEITGEIAQQRDTCDERRAACLACIERARKEGVLK